MNDADVLTAAGHALRDNNLTWPRPEALYQAAGDLEREATLDDPDAPIPCTAGLFTRDEVSQAVNDGVDLVSGGVLLSNSAEDLLNLVVNAVMSKLDDPAVTLDEAIERSYDEEDPETVKGWVA